MNLSHFFLPHPHTHQKAHLLSFKALLAYIFIFIFLQSGIQNLSHIRPDILGISSSIEAKELINLTNEERKKNGLSPLAENSKLNEAAALKAKNMFEENYWAHYSPSGKDPWGFFSAAGYKFTYAGENLAKNFSTSGEVIQAWMASTMGHKENILNTQYTEIGMAVAYGQINGQDTVLVVQEFGKPIKFVAQAPPPQDPEVVTIPAPQIAAVTPQTPATQTTITPEAAIRANVAVVAEAGQSGVAASKPKTPIIDSFQFTKVAGISLLTFLAILLAIDLIILRQRAVVRISSRHWSHFALMAVAVSAIANSGGGQVL